MLYFACIPFPPFDIDADHWFPFAAAATGIRAGDWPYFNGLDSSYGLLAPAAFAVWTVFFGLSSASLAGLIATSNAVCGVLAFTLIRRLTGSRAAAFLGASILLLQATHTLAVTSTFRAPIQIMLGAVFLWMSLGARARPAIGGFGTGFTALWNPPFGLFALAGFTLAHGWSWLHVRTRPHSQTAHALLAAIAGLLLPLAVIGMMHAGHISGLSQMFSAAASAGTLSLAGYGNIAQHFDPLVLPAVLFAMLLFAGMMHRWQRRHAPTPRILFVAGSLVTALPYFVYATGRADASHHLALYWALLPSMAFVFMAAVRLFARSTVDNRPASSMPRSPGTRLILLVLFLALFPVQRLADTVGLQVTRYESGRERWYGDCASGRGCDPAAKPSLAHALRDAFRPIPEADPERSDPRLRRACEAGLVIISFVDAWVYATAGCYSPIGIPTLALINTQADLERYLDMLATRELLLFHESGGTYAAWRGNMLGTLRTQLITRGFRVENGCGPITFLVRGNASAPVQDICEAR